MLQSILIWLIHWNLEEDKGVLLRNPMQLQPRNSAQALRMDVISIMRTLEDVALRILTPMAFLTFYN